MTSRERIDCALSNKMPDRVPISTYELVAYDFWGDTKETVGYDVVGSDFKGWYHRQPSYADLLTYLRQNTDCFYMWFPDELSGSGKFLNGFDFPKKVETERTEHRLTTRMTIETPRGPLSTTTRVDKGVNTVWETEHLLKDIDDIDKLLSIPFEPYRPDLSSYGRIRSKLGNHGIMLPNLGDPILYVAELFGFTEFTVLCYTEKRRMKYLMDVMFERVLDNLQYQLDGGVGDLFRIVGPEYATAPFLSKEYFSEFVAAYDRKLVECIHAGGAKARLHSHGRINDLIDIIRDMDVDALDPIEDFPSGDIALDDAKAKLGNTVTLFGNIQLRDLEAFDEAAMVELTRRTLQQGMEDGGFILMPTSAPIDAIINPVTERNYHAMIDTVLEYGRY